MRVHGTKVERRLVVGRGNLQLELLGDIKVHDVRPVVNDGQVDRAVPVLVVEPRVCPQLQQHLAHLDMAVLRRQVERGHGILGRVPAVRVEGVHLDQVNALLRVPNLSGVVKRVHLNELERGDE